MWMEKASLTVRRLPVASCLARNGRSPFVQHARVHYPLPFSSLCGRIAPVCLPTFSPALVPAAHKKNRSQRDCGRRAGVSRPHCVGLSQPRAYGPSNENGRSTGKLQLVTRWSRAHGRRNLVGHSSPSGLAAPDRQEGPPGQTKLQHWEAEKGLTAFASLMNT